MMSYAVIISAKSHCTVKQHLDLPKGPLIAQLQHRQPTPFSDMHQFATQSYASGDGDTGVPCQDNGARWF